MDMKYFHILEDNKIQKEELEKIIKEIIKKNNYELREGVNTSDPDLFLKRTEKYKVGDIYFLDNIIKIDGREARSGIDVGEIIRNRENGGKSFFVLFTEHQDYVAEAFDKLENYYYIPKEWGKAEKRIGKAIKNYIELTNGKTRKKTRESLIPDLDQILMIKTAAKNYVDIITEQGNVINLTSSLKKYEEELEFFYLCNSSTLVNINKIMEYNVNENTITMKNGEKIEVSYRNRGKIKKLLKK